MDKNTLSNYGWIVIAVLVLSVMIALATPFGSYIEQGVRATTEGLFDTNKNAVNTAFEDLGVQMDDQTFEEGYAGGQAGTQQTPTENLNHNGIIPEGAIYTQTDSTVLNAGDSFPETISRNDIYTYGDYKYTSLSGVIWSVVVVDKTKTEYGPMLESINGKSVTIMKDTFKDCTSLITLPAIPHSVTNMTSAFEGCSSLTDASGLIIPSSVTSMQNTFKNCKKLEKAPTIPNTVTDLYQTFYFCSKLTTVNIPENVSNIEGTFAYCSSLNKSFVIPSTVKYMNYTFNGCKKLATAPDMSKVTKVTGLYQTFYGCTALTDLTNFKIPSSVTGLSETFFACTSLTNAPEIPSSVTKMNKTFQSCSALTVAPLIPSSVNSMTDTFTGCKNLSGEISIPCSLISKGYTYAYCSANLTYYHIDGCNGSCGA